MKLYELTFSDPERGIVRCWRRNQKQCTALKNKWEVDFPLRQLMHTKYVEVPTDKTEFVKWLNENVTRTPV